MDLNKVVEEGDFSWSDFLSAKDCYYYHSRRTNTPKAKSLGAFKNRLEELRDNPWNSPCKTETK